jgi:transposase-like protein
VSTNIGSLSAMMTTSKSIYRGYRFPAEVIQQAVWLCFRFPLSRRMVEDLLAARGIIVSFEAVRCWAETFGRIYANKIRRRAPQFGDKWHLDEVVLDQRQGRCHINSVGPLSTVCSGDQAAMATEFH